MKQQLFFTRIEHAWKTFLKKRRMLLFTTLAEVFFFYFLTKIHVDVFLKIQEHLVVVMDAIQQQTEAVADVGGIGANVDQALLADPTVVSAYNTILGLLGLFFVLLLANWMIFQGINWWIANSMTKKKVPFAAYAWKFITFTLFWFVCLIALLVAFITLTNYASFSVLPLIGQSVVQWAFFIFLALIGYFAAISYSIIPEKAWKKTWNLGLFRAKQIVPAFIVALLLIFVAGGIATWLTRFHYSISLGWAIIVALPSITLARLYFIDVVNHIKK